MQNLGGYCTMSFEKEENYRIKQGETIKQLRKERGMTQAELCRDKDGTEICTERTLSRIENGQTAVPSYTLTRLLENMGVDIIEFDSRVNGYTKIRFDNDIEEIGSLIFGKDYNEYVNPNARIKFEELKKADYYDKKIPHYNQYILLMEGIFSSVQREPQKALEFLYEALKISKATLFKKHKNEEEYLNIEGIKSSAFNMLEHRILASIANINNDLSQSEGAIDILKNVIASLNNHPMDITIQNRILVTTYYNISCMLLKIKAYRETIHYCDKGIHLCIETKTNKNLAWLYENKAVALFYLNNKESATENFKLSVDTSKSNNDTEEAKKTVKETLMKYDIAIL